MKLASYVSICIAALVAQPACANDAHHPGTGSASVAQTAAPLTDAEIRKIDKVAKKITLKHAAIANLDMPAMTMVFQVADDAVLDRFKAGDKVRFAADRTAGAFTVTKIELQK